MNKNLYMIRDPNRKRPRITPARLKRWRLAAEARRLNAEIKELSLRLGRERRRRVAFRLAIRKPTLEIIRSRVLARVRKAV